MAEEKQQNHEPQKVKRTAKRVWLAASVIVIVTIVCCLFWKTGLLNFQSVDEQLAAIENARAIPNAENAAIIYYQLLQDEPLKDQQDIISTLLEASEKEKCRFPIITDPQQMSVQMDRLNAMRKWTRLLVSAINNDIAEGRIDAGIQKCNCLIQMGKHLYQQPVLISYMVGFASEALALRSMNTFILEGDVSEEYLKTIEAAVPQAKDNWAEFSSKIIEFETLYERKNVSFFKRAGWWLRGLTQDVYEGFHTVYLRLLASRRGSRILIALRRYRNKNGRWPESLDDVKSLAPAEIFVDPINGGSFVYKLTEENFTLYSKGRNNIDEGGERNQSGADDCLIWPTSSRKSKKENTDTEQSSTQKDIEN